MDSTQLFCDWIANRCRQEPSLDDQADVIAQMVMLEIQGQEITPKLHTQCTDVVADMQDPDYSQPHREYAAVARDILFCARLGAYDPTYIGPTYSPETALKDFPDILGPRLQPERAKAASNWPCIQQTIGFLDLPAELRNNIYSMAFVKKQHAYSITEPRAYTPTNVSVWKGVAPKVAPPRSTFRPPAITQICRQVRDESLPMFYSINTFNIVLMSPEDGKQAKKWLSSLDVNYVRFLKRVVVTQVVPFDDSGAKTMNYIITRHDMSVVVEDGLVTELKCQTDRLDMFPDGKIWREVVLEGMAVGTKTPVEVFCWAIDQFVRWRGKPVGVLFERFG